MFCKIFAYAVGSFQTYFLKNHGHAEEFVLPHYFSRVSCKKMDEKCSVFTLLELKVTTVGKIVHPNIQI